MTLVCPTARALVSVDLFQIINPNGIALFEDSLFFPPYCLAPYSFLLFVL